jgi:hypothetical protein
LSVVEEQKLIPLPPMSALLGLFRRVHQLFQALQECAYLLLLNISTRTALYLRLYMLLLYSFPNLNAGLHTTVNVLSCDTLGPVRITSFANQGLLLSPKRRSNSIKVLILRHNLSHQRRMRRPRKEERRCVSAQDIGSAEEGSGHFGLVDDNAFPPCLPHPPISPTAPQKARLVNELLHTRY